MNTTTAGPISTVLESLDSHGIYDLGWIMAELRGAGYTGPAPEGMSVERTAKAIEARGLGGELAPEDYPGQLLVAGYVVARAVALALTGTAPGDRFHGRGSSHRANVAAIMEHEANAA